MKIYLVVFVCFVVIHCDLTNGAPTPAPEPQFPFTVLPPKGKGHRKGQLDDGQYNRNRGDKFYKKFGKKTY